MNDDFTLLQRLYERFNAQDIEGVLSALADDVVWANAMEGGYVHGCQALRDYWTRQWALVRPHVEPVDFRRTSEGTVIVQVRQTIRDLQGQLHEAAQGLRNKTVSHVFHLREGQIARFDVQEEQGPRDEDGR